MRKPSPKSVALDLSEDRLAKLHEGDSAVTEASPKKKTTTGKRATSKKKKMMMLSETGKSSKKKKTIPSGTEQVEEPHHQFQRVDLDPKTPQNASIQKQEQQQKVESTTITAPTTAGTITTALYSPTTTTTSAIEAPKQDQQKEKVSISQTAENIEGIQDILSRGIRHYEAIKAGTIPLQEGKTYSVSSEKERQKIDSHLKILQLTKDVIDGKEINYREMLGVLRKQRERVDLTIIFDRRFDCDIARELRDELQKIDFVLNYGYSVAWMVAGVASFLPMIPLLVLSPRS